eukprot:3623062-Prymnesium_polylepis.1
MSLRVWGGEIGTFPGTFREHAFGWHFPVHACSMTMSGSPEASGLSGTVGACPVCIVVVTHGLSSTRIISPWYAGLHSTAARAHESPAGPRLRGAAQSPPSCPAHR